MFQISIVQVLPANCLQSSRIIIAMMMEGKRKLQSGKTSERRENGLLGRVVSSRQVGLRENYIINRDNEYNRLKGDVQQLIKTPQFNRYISLKKIALQNAQNLIHKPSFKQTDRRKSIQSAFNRRQLYFMRQRRPDYNSPVKVRGKFPEEKKGKVKAKEQENTMLIKQLVTHFQEPKGTITPQEDPYSPRSLNKYYVAEVIKQHSVQESPIRQHIFSSLYFLQLLAQYSHPDKQPIFIPLDLPKKDKYRDKITVVFDLDQTLVHCFQELTEPHQIQLPVKFYGGSTMIAPLNIRPGAKQILASLAEHFQLIVFTASHECYANAVLDYLDPHKKYIQHRLYRNHCVYVDEGYYVKDLRILGRDLSKVVLVDNAAYSFSFQIDNGIPILPYYQGKTDYELKALRQYLLGLTGDVRQVNKKTFRLGQYVNFSQVEQLVKELYL